jgi:hypothetical protein
MVMIMMMMVMVMLIFYNNSINECLSQPHGKAAGPSF